MLPEKGKELVKHVAADFIEAEQRMKEEQIKQLKLEKDTTPEIL